MTAAANLVETTQEESAAITSELDAREKADLDTAYGVVERGRRPREYAPALAALERGQKTRAKRRHLDVVDRGLMDLVSVYRDAIALATQASSTLVNEEMRGEIGELARRTSPEDNLRRIDRDLHRPRADAGVQRPAGLGPGVHDDGAAADGRGTQVSVDGGSHPGDRRWVVVLVALVVLGALVVVGIAVVVRADDPDLGPSAGAVPDPSSPAAAETAPVDPSVTEPPDPALAPYYSQTLDWEDCESGHECATLEVPLDYGDPERRHDRPRAAAGAGHR